MLSLLLEKALVRPVLSTQFPANKTARIGDNVTFQCIELFSPILTHYRWVHWNRLPPNYPDLGSGDDLQSSNSTYYTVISPRHYRSFPVQKGEGKYGGRVLLTNVTKEDEGMYTCLISNFFGKSWRSSFLRVLHEGWCKCISLCVANILDIIIIHCSCFMHCDWSVACK